MPFGTQALAAFLENGIDGLDLVGRRPDIVDDALAHHLRRAVAAIAAASLAERTRIVLRHGACRHQRCRVDGLEPDGGIWGAQHIGALFGDDLEVGRHARQQGHVLIADRDHARVGHDILHRLRAKPDQLHGSFEGTIWKRIDRERHLLAGFDAPHIRLVDVRVDLDLAQILRHREQGRRGKRGCDRLPKLDLALHHDPVDRRTDVSVRQVDLDILQPRLPLQKHRVRGRNLGCREGDVGIKAQNFSACRSGLRVDGSQLRRLDINLGSGGIENGTRTGP